MAHYDPGLDEIHDAPVGSYAFEHEYRHREQYRTGATHWIDVAHGVILIPCGILAVALTVLKEPMILMVIGCLYAPVAVFLLWLEVDAHLVAILRMWRRKRLDRRMAALKVKPVDTIRVRAVGGKR